MNRPRRGLFWPLVLIALGLVFLLANYGAIGPVSWLAIANLWPLLLILIGIDIAFARRWPIPALAAEVLLIAAGLALAAANPMYGSPFPVFTGGAFGPGEADVSASRGTARQVALHVNGGAGTYHVTGGASALLEAHSTNADLRLRQSLRGATADLRLDQTARGAGLRIGGDAAPSIDVKIASDVPTSLELNMGAGEFTIDLSGVLTTDARINTGASTLLLVLGRANGEVPVRIAAGASSIVVQVPDGLEARISTSGGLVSLRSDNARVGQGGGPGGCVACGSSVETAGYVSARERVTVTISAGASSVTVR